MAMEFLRWQTVTCIQATSEWGRDMEQGQRGFTPERGNTDITAKVDFQYISHVRYVGEYVEDLQEGSGTAYYSSGAVKYVGEWSGGSPHGNGTYIALNGDR